MKLLSMATLALVVVGIVTFISLAEAADVSSVVGQDLELRPTLQRYLQTRNNSTSDVPLTPPTTPPPPSTPAPPSTPTPSDTPKPPVTPTSPDTPPPAQSPVDPPTTAPPSPTSTPPVSPPTPTSPTPESPPSTPVVDVPTPTPNAPNTPKETAPTQNTPNETPQATPVTPEETNNTANAPQTTPSISTSPTNTTPSQATSPSSPTFTAPGTDAASNAGSSSNGEPISDKSSSNIGTGAVIGIVVGIIAAVAIVFAIIMWIIRRRRDSEEDPLSPFELSIDKGFNPTPGGFNAQNSLNSRGMGGPVGSGMSSNTRTPPINAVAAGVAYSQFYDNAQPTSPTSMNRKKRNVDSAQTDFGNDTATNSTNLWLSAMEPKDNESYLSAQESPRSSHNSSRNSYEMSSTENIDMDQSSIISRHSHKESEDFPDHNDDNDSARGSYEL